MKKLALIFLVAVQSVAGCSQLNNLRFHKVKKREESVAVLNSVRAQFPDAEVSRLSFVPYEIYCEEWNVCFESVLLNEIRLYKVRLKQGEKEFTNVYDKKGKIVSSRTIFYFNALPQEVRNSINNFKDWRPDHTHEYIQYNAKNKIEMYRVKLQKGAERKIIFIDPQGNIRNTEVMLY